MLGILSVTPGKTVLEKLVVDFESRVQRVGRKNNFQFSTKLADEESNELIFAFISIFDQIQAECRDAGKGTCLSLALEFCSILEPPIFQIMILGNTSKTENFRHFVRF